MAGENLTVEFEVQIVEKPAGQRVGQIEFAAAPSAAEKSPQIGGRAQPLILGQRQAQGGITAKLVDVGIVLQIAEIDPCARRRGQPPVGRDGHTDRRFDIGLV